MTEPRSTETPRADRARLRGVFRRALRRPPYLVAWKAWSRVHRWAGRFSHWEKLLQVSREWTRAGLMVDLEPRFFATSTDIDQVITCLRDREPDWCATVQSRAESVRNRDLFILGVGDRRIDHEIQWLRDYRSGLQFPGREYCFGIDLFDFGRPSDVRVVWELSRLHFLIDLGKAYRLTGNGAYFQEFRSIAESWITANPVGRGVNWSCAMDVAIRAVNLLWAIVLFLPCGDFEDVLLNRLLKLVIAHGRFIRRNLEYNDLRNNHYLSDLLGLLLIGQFFPELREARRWRSFAVRRLEKESAIQIHSDGVDYEGSIPYQQLVAEIYLVAEAALRRRGEAFNASTSRTIQSMLEFVAAYTKPNGRAPVIGDNDDGRIAPLGGQSRGDHRHLLSTGAVLFDRADLAAAAGQLWEETVWLLGCSAEAKFDSLDLPGRTWESRAFPHGGVYVMTTESTHVVIDAGDVGMRGRGAHGHHDVLSFELVMNGAELVIDSGCSSYTADRDERRRIISAVAHNVPVVGGGDIASADTWGFVQAGPTPVRVLEWDSDPGRDLLIAEHYGYRDGMIAVRRSFELDKRKETLTIRDTVSGTGADQVSIFFHLHPSCDASIVNHQISISAENRTFILEAEGEGKWVLETADVYLQYAIPTATLRAEWRTESRLPLSVAFSVRSPRN